MNLENREEIEWTNGWISNANKRTNRCLVIGDSTIRQLRSSLELLATEFFVVDAFCTSYAIYDFKLMEYLKIFFKGEEYSYQVIFMQLGGHHGFNHKCSESIDYEQEYRVKYTEIFNFVKKNCKELIVLSSTFEREEENNPEIACRNTITQEIAEKGGAKFFDVCKLMKDSCYKYSDHCHFYRESDYYINYHLMKFLFKERILISINKEREIRGFLNNKKLLIYGSGRYGQEIYWLFKCYGIENYIYKYVESKKEKSGKIFEKQIVDINSVNNTEEYIVVISSEQYETEMRQNAENKGIRNIITKRDLYILLFR